MWIRSLLSILFLPALLAAEPPAVRPAAIRDEMVTVERSINARFQRIDEPATIILLTPARGAYLDGFGTVFTLEVNLAPIANVSPFQRSYSEEQRRLLNIRKQARLENLESDARVILIEEAGRLPSLPPEHSVALVISLFHFGWEDLTKLPGQFVMQAEKQTLLDLAKPDTAKAEIKAKLVARYY
jgi:hypothetical protein